MVRLAAPVTIVGDLVKLQQQMHLSTALTARWQHVLAKYDTSYFDLTKGSLTYIDAIGIPRGVSDEYKLDDQVAADLENIPILVALSCDS